MITSFKPTIFLALIFFSCKLQTKFYKHETSIVKFGCGGGFTGNISTGQLNGEGKIFRFNSIGKDTVFYENISKEKLKEIETMLKNDSLKTAKLHEVGNMTCFLEVIESNEVKYRYTWPQGTTADSGAVWRMYNYLEKLMK